MAINNTFVNQGTPLSVSFDRLINEAYPRIYNIAYRLSGNRQDAEDLTQEACYRAFRSFDDYQGDRPFTNWIFRIVTRLYLDLRRGRSRRVREVSIDAPLGGGESDRFFEPADSRPNPEEILVESFVNEELIDALEGLSPSQQKLIELVDLNGLERDTVAENLGTPQSTVRSRLHRAHKQLRQHLAGKRAVKKAPLSQLEATTSPTPIRRIRTTQSMPDWSTTSFVKFAETFA